MKSVRLPIFEDGLELQEYLEIDIVHFLGAASSEIAHNHMRVVQSLTPEQEKEEIDRIIAGLPPRHPSWDEREEAEFKSPSEWRIIPEFPSYEISTDREVYDIIKCEKVDIRNADKTKERWSVILRAEGRPAHMNVSHLFYSAFPELKK